jgi:hypothetical protein
MIAARKYQFLFSGYTFIQEQVFRKIREVYPLHIFAEYINDGLHDGNNFDVFKNLKDV